jgi:hypothetical protein
MLNEGRKKSKRYVARVVKKPKDDPGVCMITESRGGVGDAEFVGSFPPIIDLKVDRTKEQTRSEVDRGIS